MKFIAKTLYGLEKVLADELRTIGASDIKIVNRAVLFGGSIELMYRVNYCSRASLSVLRLISSFNIGSKDDLYRKTSEIDWSALLDADNTISVVPVINSKLFTHTKYPALIVKDAVADHFRNKAGKRPSVDTGDPDLIINVHISGSHTDITIDSSGKPLYKRGYRTGVPLAPLNEVLAAGIIMLSGWDASCEFTDPMCGSGTFPVEAGLIACRVPPGKFRKEFGFMRWKDYDKSLFNMVREKGDSVIRESPVRIYGSDISDQAVKQSLANVRNARLEGTVSIEENDFRNLKPSRDDGFLFINPPYGERLKPGDLNELYSMIGTTLKHNYSGFRAWIITSGKEFLANIGLRPKKKYTLFNGSLECILAEFELYQGTRKHQIELKS